MANEKNQQAARADLNIARLLLETFAELSGKGKNRDIEAMVKKIDQPSNKLKSPIFICRIAGMINAI